MVTPGRVEDERDGIKLADSSFGWGCIIGEVSIPLGSPFWISWNGVVPITDMMGDEDPIGRLEMCTEG